MVKDDIETLVKLSAR